ncbi:Lrp/AsnC ligand binding domain-containing protein [Candidatus Bathyarchaeota archaeon]|nr:Lrp/AsnC ligand binding domain-containing protein [Candidatus Bathyarchaeota archaeon]
MLNACVLLKVVPTKADAILAAVQAIKEVRKAYFTYGRFDIAVFLEVEDYKQLRDITGRINEIAGVRSTETLAEA